MRLGHKYETPLETCPSVAHRGIENLPLGEPLQPQTCRRFVTEKAGATGFLAPCQIVVKRKKLLRIDAGPNDEGVYLFTLITHDKRTSSLAGEPVRFPMQLRINLCCLSKFGCRTTAVLDIFILAKWVKELEEGKGTLVQATARILVRRIARTGAVIP